MEGKRTGAVQQRPLKAVFFLDAVSYLAPMLAAWREAGHEAVAFVMPQTGKVRRVLRRDRWFGRLAPTWSISRVLSAFPDTSLIKLPFPVDWQMLQSQLADMDVDVLISAYFPTKVPAKILSVFPCGGVNLHPAILPAYRGSQPLQQMVLHDDWLECGGVTLHCMSDRFDEGDIIAQVHFKEHNWINVAELNRALAGAMAKLVQEAVPAFCRGDVRAVPQPEGEHGWAGIQMDTRVKPDWTVDHLRRVLTFLAGRPGVFIEIDGTPHKLSARDMRVIGPPDGQPMLRSGKCFEFDVKDARVSCTVPSRFRRRLGRVRGVWRLRKVMPEKFALTYADESVAED